MEASITADSLPAARHVPARRRWTALVVILLVNLLVVSGLWLSSAVGWGSFWMPMGYDLLHLAAGTVLLAQYVTLAIWATLSEPRSPFRWPLLVAICAVSGLIVAVVFFPARLWQFVGSRGFPWGVLFWEIYVNWMLVAC